MSAQGFFADVPWLALRDVQVFRAPTWDRLDDVASAWLGRPCLALPSVRVGLCWALEAKGYARHRDHIVVPRFVGRCILNALGRFAFPVEAPTAQTRIAMVVDRFGHRQDLQALAPHFQQAGWSYLEDSPYGIGADETPGSGSLGRFIGLGKVLPLVQGALFVAGDEAISRAIRAQREKWSPWAIPVWLTMLFLRRQFASTYSAMADAAYEMYPAARGGCSVLRGNISAVFKEIEKLERENQARIAAVQDALGNHVLVPDQRRLGYVVPFLPGDDVGAAQAVFRQCGFSDSALHIDLSKNMLKPNYVKCIPIPLHGKIPRSAFDQLLRGLTGVHGSGEPT